MGGCGGAATATRTGGGDGRDVDARRGAGAAVLVVADASEACDQAVVRSVGGVPGGGCHGRSTAPSALPLIDRARAATATGAGWRWFPHRSVVHVGGEPELAGRTFRRRGITARDRGVGRRVAFEFDQGAVGERALVGGLAGNSQRAGSCRGGMALLAGVFDRPRDAARVERLGCGDAPAVAVGHDGPGGQQPVRARLPSRGRCAERLEPSGARADGVVEDGGGAVLDRVLAFLEGLGEVVVSDSLSAWDQPGDQVADGRATERGRRTPPEPRAASHGIPNRPAVSRRAAEGRASGRIRRRQHQGERQLSLLPSPFDTNLLGLLFTNRI